MYVYAITFEDAQHFYNFLILRGNTKMRVKRANQKSKTKNQYSPNKNLVWIVIIVSVLIAAGLFYWINKSDKKSNTTISQDGSSQSQLSADLVRANQLTEEVFYYVEMVETKKLTKEEADKKSSPVKVELQQIRSRLSKKELVYNDSIRKAYGNMMVDNVMKWRQEMGLIKPDTIWTQPK